MEKKKETKLQELERRIRDLENRNIQFVPYQPPVPFLNQIPQGFSRCGICGAIYTGIHYCGGTYPNYPITYC